MQPLTLSIDGLTRIAPEIWDDVTTPEGIDKDTMIQQILFQNGAFELLYPSAEYMRFMLGVWAKTNNNIWEKLYKTTQLEYNVIENFDRYEEYSDNTEGTSGNVTENISGVSAYNSDEFVNSGSNTTTSKSEGDSTNIHTGHLHGNIGVTTNQQMIREERNIVQFNIYEFIADSFKNRFCIRIY